MALVSIYDLKDLLQAMLRGQGSFEDAAACLPQPNSKPGQPANEGFPALGDPFRACGLIGPIGRDTMAGHRRLNLVAAAGPFDHDADLGQLGFGLTDVEGIDFVPEGEGPRPIPEPGSISLLALGLLALALLRRR